jgi:hypothetical protein
MNNGLYDDSGDWWRWSNPPAVGLTVPDPPPTAPPATGLVREVPALENFYRNMATGAAGLAHGTGVLATGLAARGAELFGHEKALDPAFHSLDRFKDYVDQKFGPRANEHVSGWSRVAGLAGQAAPMIAGAALTGGAGSVAEGASLGMNALRMAAAAAPLSAASALSQTADAVRSRGLSTGQAERMLAGKYGEQELLAAVPFSAGGRFAEAAGLTGLRAVPVKAAAGAATQVVAGPAARAVGNLGLDETTREYAEPVAPGWEDLISGAAFGALHGNGGLKDPRPDYPEQPPPTVPPRPSDHLVPPTAPLSAGRVVSGGEEKVSGPPPGAIDASAPSTTTATDASSTKSRPRMGRRVGSAFRYLTNANPNMDWRKTLEKVRDINDLGAYLDGQGAEDAAGQLKKAIGRMGIEPPTPDQLGAVKKYVQNERGEMVSTYDPHDLLGRYRKAIQMAALERQGTIELDRDAWKIKSIGAARLAPEQFLQEARSRYLQAFSDAAHRAEEKLASGGKLFRFDVPPDLQRGLWADIQSKKEMAKYADSIGVPEGAGQLLALNRRAYHQDGSGQHVRPDVLIHLGIENTHVSDGKAIRSTNLSTGMTRQLQNYHGVGATEVFATTPHGHVHIPPKATGLMR